MLYFYRGNNKVNKKMLTLVPKKFRHNFSKTNSILSN